MRLSGRSGVRLAALASAAVLGTTALVAAPASAADGWQPTSNVDDSSFTYSGKVCALADGDTWFGSHGEGCFQPYGELVWVKDNDANGRPVGVDWWYWGPDGSYREGVIYDSLGKANGWTNVNKSFAEYGTFSFRVCEVNISTRSIYTDTCGGMRHVTT